MTTAPHCGHAIVLGYTPMRGLCKNCVRKYRSAIQHGKFTWAELEAKGLCGPEVKVVHPWRKGVKV